MSDPNEVPEVAGVPAASELPTPSVEPGAASEDAAPTVAHTPLTIPKSRVGGVWKSLVPALIVAAVMVIFVVQNLQDAKVSFLAFSGRFPLALALLVAAALGALVVFCLGTVRMVQLRKAFRRHQATRETTHEER
jgi:uncharacterized integral membrane protein